jgi:hypothetical protein
MTSQYSSFHHDDLPSSSSDPLVAEFFETVAFRALAHSSFPQENFLEASRSPNRPLRLPDRKIWLLFPLFIASHGLVWFFTYLSAGGVNGTIALKFFNSNRQQIEFCQKHSLPTCSLDTPVLDKLVDKTPF